MLLILLCTSTLDCDICVNLTSSLHCLHSSFRGEPQQDGCGGGAAAQQAEGGEVGAVVQVRLRLLWQPGLVGPLLEVLAGAQCQAGAAQL